MIWNRSVVPLPENYLQYQRTSAHSRGLRATISYIIESKSLRNTATDISRDKVGWAQAHTIIDRSFACLTTCLAFKVTYWWPQCSPPLPPSLRQACTRVLDKSEYRTWAHTQKKRSWPNYKRHTQSSQLKIFITKCWTFWTSAFFFSTWNGQKSNRFQYETFSFRKYVRDMDTGISNSPIEWWDEAVWNSVSKRNSCRHLLTLQ